VEDGRPKKTEEEEERVEIPRNDAALRRLNAGAIFNQWRMRRTEGRNEASEARRKGSGHERIQVKRGKEKLKL
jgi:hypothetical protein